MLLEIHGLSISMLEKASNDKVVSVDIIANHLTEDSEGEVVLKEAFSPEAVKEFLDVGVIDFWHDSKNPASTKSEKNSAIIGKPVAFRWENGLPIVTAELTKGHAEVQKMLPHLEASQPVYAASVGGSKMVLEAMDSTNKKHRVIPKIKWDHLAIAPANQVINRSSGMNVRLLQKANDIICEFDDMGVFSSNLANVSANEEVLCKALMAPSSVSDTSNTSGGVVTKQSLEGAPVSLTLSEDEGLDLIDTIIGIKQKKIPATRAEYMKHFKKKGKKDFADKSYGLIDKYFKSLKERK